MWRLAVDPASPRGDVAGALPRATVDELLLAAPAQGMAGVVGAALAPYDPSGAAGRLRDDCLHRQVRVVATLHAAARALSGSTWAAFKGPALAWGAWPRPTERWASDLDLLVPSAGIDEAEGRLRAAGFVPVERNWSLVRELRLGQIHLVAPTGVTVDLHHDVLHHGSLRDRFPLRGGHLLERSSPVTVAGVEVPTFDPVDTVLHLALHTAVSGAQRLSWYLDVRHAVAAAGPRLDRLPARARETGLTVPVALVLATARRMGADVGVGLLRELRTPRSPAAWAALRGLSAVVDVVEPVGAHRRTVSPRRSLHQSVAATAPATVQQLGRRVGRTGRAALVPSARQERLAPRPSLADADPHAAAERLRWLQEARVAGGQPGGPSSAAAS